MARKYRYIIRFKNSPFWYTNFTVRGRRVRISCKTANARDAESIALALLKQYQAPPEEGHHISLGYAVLDYIESVSNPTYRRDRSYALTMITQFFGVNTALHHIGDKDVAAFITMLKKPTKKNNKPFERSNATINRYVGLLAIVLKHAKAKGYASPSLEFVKHKLKEPDHRIRYLSTSEAERLIDNAADHLKPIIRFALMTGARKANILSLTWEQVDFVNGLIRLHVKSDRLGGKLHMLPLYSQLRKFMHKLTPQDVGPVFTYKDQPVLDVKKAFGRACERAGIDNFRFHDLRHTCASWLVQNGVELVVIKELLGHQNIKTTLKYAHLSKQDIGDKVEKVIGRKMAELEILDDSD